MNLILSPRPVWQEQAICPQTDPDAFYPDHPLSAARDAKRVCARCPVTQQCLAHALNTDEPHGVWGGKTRSERRRMARGVS